jgi:hypothetical protein
MILMVVLQARLYHPLGTIMHTECQMASRSLSILLAAVLSIPLAVIRRLSRIARMAWQEPSVPWTQRTLPLSSITVPP